MNTPSGKKIPRVVIVGSGFGGLALARALRNAPVKVVVIDRANHHLFQPLLYQVATAILSPAEIATPIRQVLRRQKNTHVFLAEVSGVDTGKREVRMDYLNKRGEPFGYDFLILATVPRSSEGFILSLISLATGT